MPGRPTRFIIKVGYACNNNCLFCHSSPHKHLPPPPAGEIVDRIRQAQEAGADGVLFSGGEPTIRRDLTELAEECRRRGLSFGLITNGRMLSYGPLRKRLLRLGMDYVYMSLHGSQGVHDETTRSPGSYAQSMSAGAALNRAGLPELTCNAVVTNRNVHELAELVALLAPLERATIKFTYVEPKGSALQDSSLVPSPEAAAAAIGRALDHGQRLGLPPARFGVDGLPHCLDGRFLHLQNDMFTHGIAALREVDEETFYPIDYGNMGKSPRCRGCLLGDGCRGTWLKTLDMFSDACLRPTTGGVANSYNYFPTEAAPPAKAQARAVSIRREDSTNWYATDTADFSDRELLAVRDQLEQVYVQLDDAPYVTDFPAQLRKLRRVEAGDGRNFPLFEVMKNDLFLASETPVRRILSSLTGSVLDVGCGQTRYGNLLEDKLISGEISYVGVDPDPGEAIRRLAEAGRIGLTHSPIEDAVFQRERFDWVLVLRSHAHLLDLWGAYARMLGALKWGGRLLVVDNMAFGLVREKSPRHAIEALPAGERREHIRNHSLEQAADFLRRFPLVELERHVVTSQTANQWTLLLKKSWPSGASGTDTYPAA
jgi:pyruvate-formate lyase-activating enzyme/SAM-dependent methyltransferase